MVKSKIITYIFWFVALASIVFLFLPRYILELDLGENIAKENSLILNEYRKTVIQFIGGIVVVIGLYLTWRRVKTMEEQQITDRFSNAVQNLGNENLAIRLGGIYSLERIARDSQNDQWRVIEILTAFIRNQKHPSDYDPKNYELPPDIQAALNTIGNRNTSYDSQESSIDLGNAFLVNARLSLMDFKSTRFYSANLEGASFIRSNLYATKFFGANLKNARFDKANLMFANFSHGNFHNIKFIETNLKESNFYLTDLTKSSFENADLKNSEFQNANLLEVKFDNAKIAGTKFVNVENLKREQLEYAKGYKAKSFSDDIFK